MGADAIGRREIEIPDALAPGVDERRHGMETVHAVRVAADGGEGRQPLLGRLVRHLDIGDELVALLLRQQKRHQRMMCAEGVPDPVVGVAAASGRKLVRLAVPAPIAGSLGDVDHPLEAAIERGVEDRPLGVTAPFHVNERELLVPGGASGGCQALEVEVIEFRPEIGPSLFGREVGNGETHLHCSRRLREVEREPPVARLRPQRRRLKLRMQMRRHVAREVRHLESALRENDRARLRHGREHERMRLGAFERNRHQGRLFARDDIDLRMERVEPEVVAVGARMGLIPCRDPAVLQRIGGSGPRLQTKEARRAMRRDEETKTVHAIIGWRGLRRVEAHHPVRTRHRRIGRHQQMADVADFGIYPIDRFTRVRTSRPAQGDSKDK